MCWKGITPVMKKSLFRSKETQQFYAEKSLSLIVCEIDDPVLHATEGFAFEFSKKPQWQYPKSVMLEVRPGFHTLSNDSYYWGRI
jgi:hypothetical protein